GLGASLKRIWFAGIGTWCAEARIRSAEFWLPRPMEDRRRGIDRSRRLVLGGKVAGNVEPLGTGLDGAIDFVAVEGDHDGRVAGWRFQCNAPQGEIALIDGLAQGNAGERDDFR